MLTGLFFTYSESTPLRSSDRDANRNPSDGRGLVGSREERRICDPARPPYPPQTYKGQKAPSSPPEDVLRRPPKMFFGGFFVRTFRSEGGGEPYRTEEAITLNGCVKISPHERG